MSTSFSASVLIQVVAQLQREHLGLYYIEPTLPGGYLVIPHTSWGLCSYTPGHFLLYNDAHPSG